MAPMSSPMERQKISYNTIDTLKAKAEIITASSSQQHRYLLDEQPQTAAAHCKMTEALMHH